MIAENEHIGRLLELRAELIEQRRACAIMKHVETLREIAGLIDAIDKSIADEKALAGNL